MGDSSITVPFPAPESRNESEDSGAFPPRDRICSEPGEPTEETDKRASSTEVEEDRHRAECKAVQDADARRKKRLRKLRASNALYDISYYGYIASWAFLVLLLFGRIASLEAVTIIGVVGSLICVSSSMISTESHNRMRGYGDGVVGIITMVVAALLCAIGLYGLAANDADAMSLGVIGLFAWSFFPSLVSFLKRYRSEYRSYDYDEYGNVIDLNDDALDSYYVPTSSRRSSGGFSIVNEVFGIPQPIDPPPIEVSRDDMLDDNDKRWMQYIDSNTDEEDEDKGEDPISALPRIPSENIEANAPNRHNADTSS